MTDPAHRIVDQLNRVLARFMDPQHLPDEADVQQCSGAVIRAWMVSCVNAIERLAPPGSRYVTMAQHLIGTPPNGYNLARIAALVQALRDDYADGLLLELRALLNAELFDDFLDMARHLLDSGYKDPAAVLAGTVLEGHLRKLAAASGIAAVREDGRPVSADALNAALAKSGTYNTSEQKQVTAWLGRRNDAAHGHFDQYDDGHVDLMLEGVRGFINRHPA